MHIMPSVLTGRTSAEVIHGMHRQTRTARRVVLAILVSNSVWALVIPWQSTRPPTAALRIAFGLGLFAATVAVCMLMRAAASPWIGTGARYRLSGVAIVVTLAIWWPAFRWAVPGEAPWAWLAGIVAGTVALALPWVTATVVASALTGVAVCGALVFGAGPVQQALTLLGTAAAIVVMLHALVWLLRLLHTSERARDAEAALAAAEERLRFSRELHDVLGHRLTVIALKAELAGDLTYTDPEQARSENEEVRRLTASALGEVRRAVHGQTVADLSHQLESARLVLSSAGVDLRVSVDPVPLTPPESRLLAAVVREAVTNILRHARATQVDLRLESSPGGRTLSIRNDNVEHVESADEHDRTAGAGLAGLATRCSELGARLSARPAEGDGFELRVDLPARAVEPAS